MKDPLLERISPKNLSRARLADFFTSLVVGIIFSLFVESIGFFEKFFLIIIIAIIFQLGDLFESLLKRDCQVKDSGKIFPAWEAFLT
jgi:phosphatidate cytidylyltransferase